MLTINLNNFRFLSRNKIEDLNHFVAVNKSLMPHAIAVAVGCSVEEATTILLYLYGKDLVDGYILVYHVSHLENYFEKRRIAEGFLLKKDFVCPVCELLHDNLEELFYDLEFRLRDEIEFQVDQ
jgi:hypothetical protein